MNTFKLRKKYDDGFTITWNITNHEKDCKCAIDHEELRRKYKEWERLLWLD